MTRSSRPLKKPDLRPASKSSVKVARLAALEKFAQTKDSGIAFTADVFNSFAPGKDPIFSNDYYAISGFNAFSAHIPRAMRNAAVSTRSAGHSGWAPTLH